MIEVRPHDDALRRLAAEAAERHDTVPRAVHLRLLLHLPRLASVSGHVATVTAAAEADRLAASLPRRAMWEAAPGLGLEQLGLVEVDDAVARRICEQFHYLGSHREGGRSHGLAAPGGRVVALGVTTDCDVDGLRRAVLEHLGDTNPRVLARVFAFEGAPPNSLTRLFKLLCRAERADATSIVTYVNPNMGFGASSYRAGGWALVGDEPGTTYRYLDGSYVTDRALAARIGSSKLDDEELRTVFGPRYARSQLHLDPLQIFARRL